LRVFTQSGESENRVNLNRWSSGVAALQDLALSFVKDNNGDLLSEDNGFFDEAFGNEWEIVR
jgi:methionine salvage enolase-phosphatase E1